MRKFVLISLAVLVATASLVALAEVPENITIDGCAKKKAAVEFPHQAHFEFSDCVTCHHTTEGLTLENVAEMEVASCGSCHNEPEKETTPICSASSTKKNPYHIVCITCHKETAKENADSTAPTKCAACHPKAE